MSSHKVVEDRYTSDIERQLEIIGSRYPPLRDKKHQQFLFWFMWINFKWEEQPSEKPPDAILEFLCDNGNDQSIDAFYFDDSEGVVYLVQSKFTHNWKDPIKISYNELRRTADIIHYFEVEDKQSVVYQRANKTCKKLLAKAYRKKSAGYPVRVILVSNKLDPDESDLKKLEEQTDIALEDWDFEVICRPKIIRLYAEFLEGHNPPIQPYVLRTVNDEYLRLSEPKYNFEAYVTVAPVNEIIGLYEQFRDRIFEKNVRSFLGDKLVNKEVRKSLDDCPELFFYKNSGLTILADDVQPIPAREGQPPGFKVKDIQVINGQQTTRILAEKRERSAYVLLTIIGPCKRPSGFKTDVEERRNMIVDIIRARNLQNKVGYADLKSNHAAQVKLWREFKKYGYYYERKRNAWKNLDHYARGIYKLASEQGKGWARIKKEDLAAEVLAVIDDPMRSFKGEDYIFRDRYDDVFSENRLKFPDWYLALHLLSKRYIYEIGCEIDNTYPRYHILSMLRKKLGLRANNAVTFRKVLEEHLHKSLLRAVKILYKLCDLVVTTEEKKQRQPLSRHLSPNDVFAKERNVLKIMDQVFSSRSFSKERKLFYRSIAKFETKNLKV